MNKLKKTAAISLTSLMLGTAYADMGWMESIKEIHDNYVEHSFEMIYGNENFGNSLEILSLIDPKIIVNGFSSTEPETLKQNLITMSNEFITDIKNTSKNKWPHGIIRSIKSVQQVKQINRFYLIKSGYRDTTENMFYANETSPMDAVLHALNTAVFSYNVSETFSDESLTMTQKVRDTYQSFVNMNMIDSALKTTSENSLNLSPEPLSLALRLLSWANVGSRLFVDPVHIEKCSNEECSFKSTVQTYMPWSMNLEQRQEFISLLAKTMITDSIYSFYYGGIDEHFYKGTGLGW